MSRAFPRTGYRFSRLVSEIGLAALLSLVAGCNRGTGVGKKTVAIITPSSTSWFNRDLAEGAKMEAETLGWNPVIVLAPEGDADDSTLSALAKQAIQKKPDAISVCGMGPLALADVIKQANAASIPIFVHNQVAPVPGDVEAYIGYDEYAAGKKCGEEAVTVLKRSTKDLEPVGQVAIIDGAPGQHNDLRVNGFRDVIKYYAHVQIVEEKSADWSNEQADKLVSKWLVDYPKLTLVYACSDQMARGASHAAYEAHSPLQCIGFGGSKDGLFDVRAGNLIATLATDPTKMGVKIMTTMMDYFGHSGVLKQGQVINTETTLVTRENINAFVGGFAADRPADTQGTGH